MASVCMTDEDEKAESDTSTQRDASMILNHSIASEEDFLIEVKRVKVNKADIKMSCSNTSFLNCADYDIFESSIALL